MLDMKNPPHQGGWSRQKNSFIVSCWDSEVLMNAIVNPCGAYRQFGADLAKHSAFTHNSESSHFAPVLMGAIVSRFSLRLLRYTPPGVEYQGCS